MGNGTWTAGESRRRELLFGWTAALVLPVIDPPVLALLSLSDAMGVPPLLGILLIAAGNWAVLWKLSEGVWSGTTRKKYVGFALAASLVIAVGFAVAEFIVTLIIVCSNQTCFS